MFTSADQKRLLHYALGDAAAALFFGLFSSIYEHFSHGVYSDAMICAYTVPLAGGTLLMLVLLRFSGRLRQPSQGILVLWHAGLAAFTVWLVFLGVLEIYGTTNRMAAVYPAVGGLMTGSALLAYAIRREPRTQK